MGPATNHAAASNRHRASQHPLRPVLAALLAFASGCLPGGPGTALTGAIELHTAMATSCALRTDGSIRCWGPFGQLLARPTPDPNVRSMGLGPTFLCTLGRDGLVRCGGTGTGGSLPDDAGIAFAPRPVEGIRDASAIGVGGLTTCVVRTAGTAACWGDGTQGQLGDGRDPSTLPVCVVGLKRTNCSSTPVDVLGVTDAVSVTVGYDGACVLRAAGRVTCWGFGSPMPREVPGIDDATFVAVGGVACVGRRGGSVVCGTPSTGFAPRGELAGARSIAVQSGEDCAVFGTGMIRCAGFDNEHGQLGGGFRGPPLSGVSVVGISNATNVTIGQWTRCALRADSSVWCWGANFDGQAGRPCASRSACDQLTPMPVTHFF